MISTQCQYQTRYGRKCNNWVDPKYSYCFKHAKYFDQDCSSREYLRTKIIYI